MHGSCIERLTGMGIGADVPFVAHFPSNRRFPQRNRHLPPVSRIVLRGGCTRSLSNGNDYDGN